MDQRQIARLRLDNQRLSGPPLESIESVVSWLGAVQAQDWAPGKWSVGQRASGLTDASLDAALADGRILRTHILRPTWHVVLPADIRWMQAVTADRVHVFSRHQLKVTGLDAPTLRRAFDLLGTALSGERRLTRPQVQAEFAAAGIVASGPRLAYILMQAELDLLITSGGLAGRQQTYALLDEVAPVYGALAIEGDEALAELTRRYFTSRGPSTVADFTWWSSLTVAEARRGLAMVESELEQMNIDGLDYWSVGFDVSSAAPSPRAHFVQGLDEYFVGYQRTRAAADVAGLGLEPAGFVDGFFHAVVIDGQLVAAVRRVAQKDGVTFETRLLRPLSAGEEGEVMAAAARYAAFLGTQVRVTWIAR